MTDERLTQPAIFVVIDMQSNLAPAMDSYAEVRDVVAKLTQAAQILNIKHVITEQNPKGLGHTDPSLLSQNAVVLTKTTFSAAQSESFLASLANTNTCHVYLCGMESHVCVYHTANELCNLGYQVTVIADAVCSRKKENKRLAMDQLRANGVQVCASETVMFAWLNSCEHPRFREVLALIK
ncbi:isochorismatase family protein [Pseudoalteromonas pernae]|uniref:isochorismatase family protein n=1 Tax=Pseudoalteromonas pernae TaxID=3118054 RepID=UPI0032420B2F